MMSKRFWLGKVCVVAAALVLAAGGAQAQQFFRIGTGGTAGTYYPVGGMIANAVSQPGKLVVTAQASNGSLANVTGIAGGAIESGFSQADVASWAYTAKGVFEGKPAITGLRLIAVDQNADAERSADAVAVRTVTVEVSPEQVAELTLAQSTGRLNLSLVGLDDTSEIGAIEVNRNDLLGIQPVRAAAPAAPARVCTIRTRKGGDVIETQIPCTN